MPISGGRADQVARAYRRVLAQRDVLMDLDADRTASAHKQAQTVLQHIRLAQRSSR